MLKFKIVQVALLICILAPCVFLAGCQPTTPSGPTMMSVPAGTFLMGNTGVGDDATYGNADELPQHEVTLSAYQIGEHDVTNQDYAAILNWALGQGYLEDSGGAAYSGGDVYSAGVPLLRVSISACQVSYSSGVFGVYSEYGLPGSTSYSMATHPVLEVTWYGAAMYCNWLSEELGLTPCYDTTTWACDFAANGYHLPTEAQWERAAAWDGAKHWTYGFMSDTLTGFSRCNYNEGGLAGYVNPLGLTTSPDTSPVGWFNGVNVSPNGHVQTMDSPSPVGCYDMSGNVYQWCQDWSGSYAATTNPPVSDPTGPVSGTTRVVRGGDWGNTVGYCRCAFRGFPAPTNANGAIGFRLAAS